LSYRGIAQPKINTLLSKKFSSKSHQIIIQILTNLSSLTFAAYITKNHHCAG